MKTRSLMQDFEYKSGKPCVELMGSKSKNFKNQLKIEPEENRCRLCFQKHSKGQTDPDSVNRLRGAAQHYRPLHQICEDKIQTAKQRIGHLICSGGNT